MKKILLVFMAVFCFSLSNAQTDSLRLYLDNLFGTLNKTQVPSGYLAAYVKLNQLQQNTNDKHPDLTGRSPP